MEGALPERKSSSYFSLPRPVSRTISGVSEALSFLSRAEQLHGKSTAGYESLITKTGRLKLLHRSEDAVRHAWARKASGSLQAPTKVLVHTRSGKKPLSGRKVSDLHVVDGAIPDGMCAVEMRSREISIPDTEADVDIPVHRRGDLSKRLELQWKIAVSCDPDLNGRSGTFGFEPGEGDAVFKGPVRANSMFTTDDYYTIELSPVNAEDNVQFGVNSRVTVYMLNQTPFPSNLGGFIYHNYTEMPRSAIKGFLYALYPALAYYFSVRLLKSVVDCVSGNECKYLGVHLPFLWMLVVELVILISLYVREANNRKLRLGGKAIRKLRHNLFTQMLQLTAEEAESYDQGDIPKIICTEVEQAVRDVWIGSFQLTTAVAQMAIQSAVAFQAGYNSSETTVQATLFSAFVVMIASCAMLLELDSRQVVTLQLKAHDAEEDWHAFVHMCQSAKMLINGYLNSLETANTVDKSHGAINRTAANAADWQASVLWLLEFSMTICRLLAVGIVGQAVINGHMSPGEFIMLNQVLRDFGKNAISVSTTRRTLVKGTAPLQKIARVLTRGTRRQKLRQQSQLDRSLMGEAIALRNVTYSYPPADPATAAPVLAVHPVSFDIRPHQLLCVSRTSASQLPTCADEQLRPHVGINTLFKIMSQELMPYAPPGCEYDSGAISVPARWLVVYVPAEPLLFDGTLMFNLVYGARKPGAVCNKPHHITDDLPTEAIWDACKAMGMSPSLIGDEDFDVGTNGERLKMSDRLIICILRAVLARVDVLMMAGVIDILGQERGTKVLQVLSDYIDQGALKGTYTNTPRLHRKTVVYTTRSTELQELGDTVLSFRVGQADSGAAGNEAAGNVPGPGGALPQSGAVTLPNCRFFTAP